MIRGEMPSRLACWIGRHTWVKRVEEGESYSVCDTRGKEREERRDRWGDAPGTGGGGDYPPLSSGGGDGGGGAG